MGKWPEKRVVGLFADRRVIRYADEDGGRGQRAGPRRERGHLAGGAGRILDDQVHFSQAKRPDRGIVRISVEHRPIPEWPHQPGTELGVRRHEQDGLHASTGVRAKTSVRNSTVKMAPRPSDLLATRMLAPCVLAMLAQIASPRPDPRSFVVMNGSKMFARSSSGMPGPVSSISTTVRPSRRARRTVSVPPGSMASSALMRRFKKSCSSPP